MVKLFCAIVGDESAFEVDIAEDASVSALKDRIKNANEDITCPARKLQLFLAKSKEGEWLDVAGATAVVSDDLQHFTPMNPTLKVGNGEYFGSNFHPGEGQVHVLVIITPEDPPRKKQRVGTVELIRARINEQAEMDAICMLGQGLNRDDLAKGKLLKIPHKILRVDLPEGLYVRQEYWDVLEIMNHNVLELGKRILVIGSPGIGKSAFGVFLLLLFMTERKNVAYQPVDTVEKRFFFTWDAAKNSYNGTLNPVSTNLYHGLFDGQEHRDWGDTTMFAHSYLFASPRTRNYNQFVKGNCFRIYMNPWTKDECQEYADAVELDEDEWFIRFSLVGGKPRFLFSPIVTIDHLICEVSQAVPDNFTKLETMVKGVVGHKFSDEMIHILFEIFRDDNMPGFCFLQFPSAYIDSLVSTTYNGEKNDNIKNLLKTSNPNLQAWRGRVCERFLLRDAAICKILVRPLDDEPRRQIIRSLGPYNAKPTSVQAASDIHAKKMVYVPVSKNFPAIDGVLVVPAQRRLIYLQATVAKRHPIKHQPFKDIIKILTKKFTGYHHILLFLVEGDTYDHFSHQNYKNMNEEDRQNPNSLGVKVTQYVGKIETRKSTVFH